MANELISTLNDYRLTSGGWYELRLCAVGDWDGDDTDGALRFSNLQIAKNQSIISAEIKYKYSAVGDNSGDWKYKVYGIDEDNTADFSSNPFGRSKTSASITVDTSPPTSGGVKTLDVKSILEEITSRSGWSSGNNVGFILEDDGSSNNVYAFADYDINDTYLWYRLSAEPNFKPTPKSVTASSLPSAESYGLKISRPGKDVFSADEDEIYFTSRKKQFKVLSEGEIVSTESDYDVISIAHNLGYMPFVMLYQREGFELADSRWIKLPTPNYFSFDYGFFYADNSNLYIYPTGQGETYYYRIFLDQLV